MKTVLFLCTGNYYRSRFAEEFFNSLAQGNLPHWKATSRGLALEASVANAGTISPYTLEKLAELNFQAIDSNRKPIQCTEKDLHDADLIIALKETEHRPMIVQRFPKWADKVNYWHIHDIDQDHPTEALPKIVKNVVILIDELALAI